MEDTKVDKKQIETVEEAKALIDYITNRAKQLRVEYPEIKTIDVSFKASKEAVEKIAVDFQKEVMPPSGKEGTFDVFIFRDDCSFRFQTEWFKVVSSEIKYEAAA